MDLALLYEVGMTYAYKKFHDVVHNWINDDRLVDINGEDYLNNNTRMAKVANDFANGSKGLLKGTIGALDGWLVKIKHRTKTQDKVRNLSLSSRVINNDYSNIITSRLICRYSCPRYYC